MRYPLLRKQLTNLTYPMYQLRVPADTTITGTPITGERNTSSASGASSTTNTTANSTSSNLSLNYTELENAEGSDAASESSEPPANNERPLTSNTTASKTEFEINPSCATILAFSKQRILIDFTSFHVKRYDIALVVDVDGVGRDMLELPIKADCKTPKVRRMFPLLCPYSYIKAGVIYKHA